MHDVQNQQIYTDWGLKDASCVLEFPLFTTSAGRKRLFSLCNAWSQHRAGVPFSKTNKTPLRNNSQPLFRSGWAGRLFFCARKGNSTFVFLVRGQQVSMYSEDIQSARTVKVAWNKGIVYIQCVPNSTH